MDQEKALRLKEKYGGTSAASSNKKEISIGPRGGGSAMTSSGKPKELRKTVLRLFHYLSKERMLINCPALYTCQYNSHAGRILYAAANYEPFPFL